MEEGKKELIHLLTWASENPELWSLICYDEHVEAEDCLAVMEKLEGEKLYQLIPVFMLRNGDSQAMEDAIQKLCLKKIVESWEKLSMEEINCEMKGMVLEAMEHLEKEIE